MEKVQIVPKRWPSCWLAKNWQNRVCRHFKGSEAFMEKVHELEVRDDDVWLVTLPKCGTTWMQEMAWLIINSFDFEKALSADLDERSIHLDMGSFFPEGIFDTISLVEQLPSPRLIKTHFPLPLLPHQVWTKRPKIIYVFRHPKDAAISMYYHQSKINHYQSKEEFLGKYISNNPEFWSHVHEFWNLRNEPNVYYTSYEKMKSDLAGVIEDVCKFCNVSLNAETMSQMLKHLSFENMKNNVQCNHIKETKRLREFRGLADINPNEITFIRKGKVGGYTDDFSKELDEMYDRWIDEGLKTIGVTLNELLLLSDSHKNK